ncbi:hypothetical protein SCFA_90051 [anaerobic digester metagenome]|uniref:Uncharacterized protein n=1 Tax=anaerobic digester metagenome TaxID=1263854 RepID=A0A485M5T6_9ZZZZ
MVATGDRVLRTTTTWRPLSSVARAMFFSPAGKVLCAGAAGGSTANAAITGSTIKAAAGIHDRYCLFCGVFCKLIPLCGTREGKRIKGKLFFSLAFKPGYVPRQNG